MADDGPLFPDLSRVEGKEILVSFDGGRLSSDGGLLLLAAVERRLGIADRLAATIADPRRPGRVRHSIKEMIRYRATMLASGYEDANDADALRSDPIFKLAVGRLPESKADLCSQPTLCRLENLPSRIELARMMDAMIELFCDSFVDVPHKLVLDIDDTEDRVHGGQQLALLNGHHDSHCFMPIHIYEAQTGKPVAHILRPGESPGGAEVAKVLRHVIGAIRRRFPTVAIVARGDGHYGRPEALDWLERNRVAYIFGLPKNKVLEARVKALEESVATERALEVAAKTAGDVENGDIAKIRAFDDFPYAAKSWKTERRVVARIEATENGADARHIVTNIRGTPRWLYEELYCARGRCENLIKAHNVHLASDRTSCHRAEANQFRLLLHMMAYWLLHEIRMAAPKTSFWRDAQLDTIRIRLIKIAARVTELATRVKIALPTSCLAAADLAYLAGNVATPRPP